MRSMRRLVVVRPQGSAGRRFGTLERQIDISNQNLKAAAAAFEQAEWIVAQARAGFFPILDLNASAQRSQTVGGSSPFWSFGPTVLQTVFDAGARSAQVEQARAVFDQDVATYRQTVLTVFQQVEDQLAALGILAQEAEVQDKAVTAAFEAARIINNQYLAGIVPYTQTALGNAETAVSIRQSRLVASAALI
jgi:outer membrane protein TolC